MDELLKGLTSIQTETSVALQMYIKSRFASPVQFYSRYRFGYIAYLKDDAQKRGGNHHKTRKRRFFSPPRKGGHGLTPTDIDNLSNNLQFTSDGKVIINTEEKGKLFDKYLSSFLQATCKDEDDLQKKMDCATKMISSYDSNSTLIIPSIVSKRTINMVEDDVIEDYFKTYEFSRPYTTSRVCTVRVFHSTTITVILHLSFETYLHYEKEKNKFELWYMSLSEGTLLRYELSFGKTYITLLSPSLSPSSEKIFKKYYFPLKDGATFSMDIKVSKIPPESFTGTPEVYVTKEFYRDILVPLSDGRSPTDTKIAKQYPTLMTDLTFLMKREGTIHNMTTPMMIFTWPTKKKKTLSSLDQDRLPILLDFSSLRYDEEQGRKGSGVSFNILYLVNLAYEFTLWFMNDTILTSLFTSVVDQFKKETCVTFQEYLVNKYRIYKRKEDEEKETIDSSMDTLFWLTHDDKLLTKNCKTYFGGFFGRYDC